MGQQSQFQQLLETQNTIIQRRQYLQTTDEVAAKVYRRTAVLAATRVLISYSAEELNAYLGLGLTAEQFFTSPNTVIAPDRANLSALELENLLTAEINLQVSYYEDFLLQLTGIQDMPEPEPEPVEQPEGTRAFTVELTYTATYGDEITVYAKDEDEAIDLAQRNAPSPSADCLVSNCECDYEIADEEDED